MPIILVFITPREDTKTGAHVGVLNRVERDKEQRIERNAKTSGLLDFKFKLNIKKIR